MLGGSPEHYYKPFLIGRKHEILVAFQEQVTTAVYTEVRVGTGYAESSDEEGVACAKVEPRRRRALQ